MTITVKYSDAPSTHDISNIIEVSCGYTVTKLIVDQTHDGTANPHLFITYNSGTDSIEVATTTVDNVGSYSYRLDYRIDGTGMEQTTGYIYF